MDTGGAVYRAKPRAAEETNVVRRDGRYAATVRVCRTGRVVRVSGLVPVPKVDHMTKGWLS